MFSGRLPLRETPFSIIDPNRTISGWSLNMSKHQNQLPCRKKENRFKKWMNAFPKCFNLTEGLTRTSTEVANWASSLKRNIDTDRFRRLASAQSSWLRPEPIALPKIHPKHSARNKDRVFSFLQFKLSQRNSKAALLKLK